MPNLTLPAYQLTSFFCIPHSFPHAKTQRRQDYKPSTTREMPCKEERVKGNSDNWRTSIPFPPFYFSLSYFLSPLRASLRLCVRYLICVYLHESVANFHEISFHLWISWKRSLISSHLYTWHIETIKPTSRFLPSPFFQFNDNNASLIPVYISFSWFFMYSCYLKL